MTLHARLKLRCTICAILAFTCLPLRTRPAVAAENNPQPAIAKHWAYKPPFKSELPEVSRASWAQQPFDRFMLQRLDRERLSPAPPADRATLVRRVTFDLTGLPPTPSDVAAFVADQSPDAYERLLDRLFASPRYGERMAVAWLDLARYADTHGYHSDSAREMWRWRDWVIDAMNANMPFDQFTIEQLAGDLLPNATIDQRLATGLHRNQMLNDENGAIPEEYLAEYVAERTATTSTIWLGQTLACARCHDHKHDPFTQRDYYRLFAFFHNVPENGLGGRNGNSPPVLSVPTRDDQRMLDKLNAELADIEKTQQVRAIACARELGQWEAGLALSTASLNAPPTDALVHLPLDGGANEQTPNIADAGLPFKLRGKAQWTPGKFAAAMLCDGSTSVEASLRFVDASSEPFTLSAWVFPTTTDTLPIVTRLNHAEHRRGFEWGLRDGRLHFRLTHRVEHDELCVQTIKRIAPRKWQHVAVAYDGTGKADGVILLVDGQRQAVEIVADSLSGHVATDEPLRIGSSDPETFFRGLLDELQIFRRALSDDEVSRLAGGDPIREIVRLKATQRSPSQQAELQRYFLEKIDPAYRQLAERRQQIAREVTAIQRRAPSVMVMAEMPEPRPTFVLQGGQYDQPGDRVTADVPASLPPLLADAPRNRLGLAKWLVAADHPLTARVTVNRQWQAFFGTGIVRTADDFGTHGELPSHPDVLDWLARDFVDNGWDVKRLQRQIVSSATYQQSSVASAALRERDPANRLLARGPQQRLSAEALRDAALQAAGLLQNSICGMPVRPYQPADLWKERAYDPDNYSAQVFQQSTGADLYRRSLYTFWKRSAPPPNLAVLDAPDRETCLVSRSPSHSPLHGLVLLNDVTFVEASRKLAERMLTEAGPAAAAKIHFAFHEIVSRPPRATEVAALERLYRSQVRHFQGAPQSTEQLMRVGDSPAAIRGDRTDLAAWTNVVGVILNLDEAQATR